MSKLKVFIFNTLTSVVTSLIFRIAFLWFNVFVSNKAGSENMGVYSLTMSVYTVLITIASSGLGLASSRITAEEIACGNEKSALKNVFNCIVFGLLCSFAATFTLFSFCDKISEILLHGKVSVLALKCLCISLPFISVSSVISGYFTAIRQNYKVSFTQLTENFIEIGTAVFLLNLCEIKNANSVCLILISSNALAKITSFIIFSLIFATQLKKPHSLHKGKSTLKRMFKIVLPVAISSHIKSTLSGIKHTLVPLKLEQYTNNCESALSEYGKINAMAMPIITFPCCFFASIANLIVPEIASLCVMHKNGKISKIISKLFKLTMIISVFAVSVAVLFGSETGFIFYKDKSIGAYIVYLAPVIPFIYFDCIVDAVLKGIDKQAWVVIINITDTVICIILIYFLLPVMGTIGYITVIYISEFFNGIASNILLKTKIKYKTDTANSIIKPAVSAILSAFIAKLLCFNVLLSFTVFTSCYIIFLFIFKSLKKEEIFFIARM